MSKERKLTLSDFIKKDQFELNSYITYLFEQICDNVPDQSEDKIVKQ